MTPTCILMYGAGVATGIALVCFAMAAWGLWKEE